MNPFIKSKWFWISWVLGFLCLQRFLLLDLKNGFHFDEPLGLFQSLNLFLHGIYSNSYEGGLGARWDCSGTSGPLSVWPSGLGLILGKSLFWARALFQCYILLLFFLISVGAFRLFKIKGSLGKYLSMTFVGYLSLLFSVNYTQVSALNELGEIPGGLLVSLGFVTLHNLPMLSALILGGACFLTKSLYIPFSVLGFIVLLIRASYTAYFSKRFFELVTCFCTPLILWNIFVLISGGVEGFLLLNFHNQETAKNVYLWNIASPLEFSWFPGALYSRVVSRLHTPSIEWMGFALIDKIRIIVFLMAPIVVLGIQAIQEYKAKKANRIDRLVLLLGGAIIFLLFTVWYFLLHRHMFIRHVEPILICGFSFLMFTVITFVKKGFNAYSSKIVLGFIFFVCFKEFIYFPRFVDEVVAGTFKSTYSRNCRFDDVTKMRLQDFQRLCAPVGWGIMSCQDRIIGDEVKL